MRSRLTHILMLIAWLLATGVQWDVVQMFAWGRMFAVNARVLSWADALERTFSVDGMCGACHAVQEAKRDGDGNLQTPWANVAKEPLVFQRASKIIISAPSAQIWMVAEPFFASRERGAPPTPPPRALV